MKDTSEGLPQVSASAALSLVDLPKPNIIHVRLRQSLKATSGRQRA